MFKKVLVANRGEIAVRILRTLREMKIASVAVYSEADKGSPHVALADEAYWLGAAAVAESYLSGDKLLAVAKRCGADALIPGYGFLSENAEFARRCAEAGIVFVGPSPEAMETMGLKPRARAHMQAAGVPVVPGGPAATLVEATVTAAQVGYPVMLKAAAGGGGRGMRRVEAADELASNFEAAAREALGAFGDATIYIEKLVVSARHIEVQVLGDKHGNLVHLFERDCSVQRRHQKVVEESPSPQLSQAALGALCDTALKGAHSVQYYSAGTFEFLVDREENFYFLEMNTRLQVEHPVTELLTGVDLVREMLCVAAGEVLSFTQEQIVRRGAAIECRIYAEDPQAGFRPSPGKITFLRPPEGPGIRHDSGVCEGYAMSFDYDAMAAKVSVWAPTRALALARMARALGEYQLYGIVTNLDFLRKLVEVQAFVEGHYDTEFINQNLPELLGDGGSPLAADSAIAAAVLVALAGEKSVGKNQAKAGTAPVEASRWFDAHRRGRLGL